MPSLQVGGMVPFSTVDFPGMLSAVIFCQGCPWRCGYCHNPHLLPISDVETDGWEKARAFLEKRRHLLDAVLFSGGEPTVQKDLALCIREARQMGFKVGLHTGGAYPDRLEAVLPWIDWIGLDMKSRFQEYQTITGIAGSGDKAMASLKLILKSKVAFECRTTLHPGLLSYQDILDMARILSNMGVRHYAVQEFRSEGCAENALTFFEKEPQPYGWLGQMESLFDTFVYRGD